MPPASKLLAEEGAAIVSFKIVRAGAFQVGAARRRRGRADGTQGRALRGACNGLKFSPPPITPPASPLTPPPPPCLYCSPHKHPCPPPSPTPQEAGITELLMAPGKLAASIPGCSGTRNLSDNLSDLKAQVGAADGRVVWVASQL
jgi:hypothetical protein